MGQSLQRKLQTKEKILHEHDVERMIFMFEAVASLDDSNLESNVIVVEVVL